MQHDQDLAVAAAYASGNPHAQHRQAHYAEKSYTHNAGERADQGITEAAAIFGGL